MRWRPASRRRVDGRDRRAGRGHRCIPRERLLRAPRDAVQIRSLDVGFPDDEYLSVRLELEDKSASRTAAGDTSRAEFLARFRTIYRELERRLSADPAVTGVTFADVLPRMYHERRFIEVDEGGAAPRDPRWPGYLISSASIDLDYFEVLDAPIVAGRGFHSGDAESGAQVVIVNQSFVNRIMGGRNPIGRRVRYLNLNEAGEAPSSAGPGPWYEIVGVARDLDLTRSYDPNASDAGFYHPLSPVAGDPLYMAVHVRGDAESFASRLRTVASAIEPTLRLDELRPLDEVNAAELQVLAFWFRITIVVSAVALLLSLAGIYAIMSFTVARRTREIGIRVALGCEPLRIALAIFRRPLVQVGLGIVAGSGLAATLARLITGGTSVRAPRWSRRTRRSCWAFACWRASYPRGERSASNQRRRSGRTDSGSVVQPTVGARAEALA
ncbi:MAG: FtsX-like permease family protein [Longimicrobiales bacterium]